MPPFDDPWADLLPRRQAQPAAAPADPWADLVPQRNVATDPQQPGLWARIKNMGARDWGALGIRGVAGLLSNVGDVPTPITTPLAAFIGGAGESLAEKVEGRDQSPREIATAAAISAVPLGWVFKGGKAVLEGTGVLPAAVNAGARVLRGGVRGAALGAGLTTASSLANRGELPSSEELLSGAEFSAAGGALASGLVRAAGKGRTGAPQHEVLGPYTPSGANIDPLDARFSMRKGGGAPSYEQPTSPFLGRAEASGAGIDPLDTRFDARKGGAAPSYEPPAVPESPYTRYEATGGQVDPLDERFAARTQGALPTDTRAPRPAADIVSSWLGRNDGEPPAADWSMAEARPGRLPLDDPWADLLPGAKSSPAAADLAPELHNPAAETHIPASGASPDELVSQLLGHGRQPDLEVLDPHTATLNASGESAASMEALNRQRSMTERGDQFVVYGRDGQRRPLIGPDAVDYQPQAGETYGVDGPEGFRLLEDRGGRPPAAAARPQRTPAELERELQERDDYDASIEPRPVAAAPQRPLRIGAGPETPAYVPGQNPTIDRVQALYDELMPKWTAARAAGKDVPFAVDQHESFPEFYQRVLTDNPRQLMGSERKVRKLIDSGLPEQAFTGAPAPTVDTNAALERTLQLLKNPDAGGEAGFASPDVLYHLGAAGAGAVAGTVADQENPELGALGGAGLGLLGTLALRNPKMLERIRTSNLFSGAAIPKSFLGNIGGAAAYALEHPGSAGRVMEAIRDPRTLARAKDAFRHGEMREAGPGGTTTGTGILDIPSRLIGAPDAATRDALGRAGASTEEAGQYTLSGRPTSWTGQKFSELVGGSPFVRQLIPVAKTATNLIERGIERTPGLGELDAVRGWTGASKELARRRQALGALALLAGGGVGAMTAPGGALEDYEGAAPYATALTGPFALPVAVGGMVGKTLNSGGSVSSAALAALKEFQDQLPIPSVYSNPFEDPGRYLGQFVPFGGATRMLYPVAQSEFDTKDDFFGRAAAQIPFINEQLVPRKPAPKLRMSFK